MKIKIYYEDTDVGGVVYHSNYLNFCERARSEAFFQYGLSPILKDGHFVAKKIIADYIQSAKLGDELFVTAKIVTMKNVSFTIKHEIFKDDKKIFELYITLAYLDFNQKIKKLDDSTKKLLYAIF